PAGLVLPPFSSLLIGAMCGKKRLSSAYCIDARPICFRLLLHLARAPRSCESARAGMRKSTPSAMSPSAAAMSFLLRMSPSSEPEIGACALAAEKGAPRSLGGGAAPLLLVAGAGLLLHVRRRALLLRLLAVVARLLRARRGRRRQRLLGDRPRDGRLLARRRRRRGAPL